MPSFDIVSEMNTVELRNAVERMMLLADGGRISLAELPPEISAGVVSPVPPGDELNLGRLEKITILRALRECGGRKKEAAERLGIALRTLGAWGVVATEAQTLVWFAATIIGVAILSGQFLRWQLLDQTVALGVLAGIAWLLARTGSAA